MAFQFPQSIYAQNSVWHLIYDPNSPNTILPDLNTAKLQNVFGQWVNIPDDTGKVGRVFMSVVDLIIPAVNTPSYRKPAQYVRGFSLSYQEVDPNSQPPQSMAIYTKELEPPTNVAQEFLNAVLEQRVAQQQAEQPKGDWTQMLPDTQSLAQPKISHIAAAEQPAEVYHESDAAN